MSIHKRRLAHGWSQEELAMHAGLSVRTIQRVERGRPASLESLKCLAAVFETSVSDLVQEQTMTNTHINPSDDDLVESKERETINYINNLKLFHMNWIAFLFFVPALFLINLMTSPDDFWVVWVIVGWSIFIGAHFMIMVGVFNLLGPKWEQKQFKKRMKKRDE